MFTDVKLQLTKVNVRSSERHFSRKNRKIALAKYPLRPVDLCTIELRLESKSEPSIGRGSGLLYHVAALNTRRGHGKPVSGIPPCLLCLATWSFRTDTKL